MECHKCGEELIDPSNAQKKKHLEGLPVYCSVSCASKRRKETEDKAWCSGCKCMHSKSEFHKNKARSNGLSTYCKKWTAEYHSNHREWGRKANAKSRAKRNASGDRKRFVQYLITDVKRRCKHRGIPFDICVSDLDTPDLCPVFKIPLVYTRSEGKRQLGTASIDRVDPSQGYVKGNVKIISWKANEMKRNCTLKDLVALIKYVKRHLRL